MKLCIVCLFFLICTARRRLFFQILRFSLTSDNADDIVNEYDVFIYEGNRHIINKETVYNEITNEETVNKKTVNEETVNKKTEPSEIERNIG